MKICFYCLLLLASLGGGCSIFDSTLTPEYKDISAKIKISSPVPITIGNITQEAPLGLHQGIKKSEYGMETAKIYTRPKPEFLFKEALAKELKTAGFAVHPKDFRESIQLDIHLTEYFVEPEISLFYAGVCGVIEANLVVIFLDGKSYRRKFKGMSKIYAPTWYSSLPVWGDEIYTATLEFAMRDFMKKAIPAIGTLVQKKGKEG